MSSSSTSSSTKMENLPTNIVTFPKRRNSKNDIELYCGAIEEVGKTWGYVKQIPNYESVVGETLFRKIFELAPTAISMFAFGKGLLNEKELEVPEVVFALDTFKAHAHRVVSMLEGVVTMMLGDNMTILANTLQDLGRRHVQFGVHPAHYGIVETALLRTLEIGLQQHWTPEVRKEWAAVFKFISKAMMSGAGEQVEISKVQRRDYERRKSATLRLSVIRHSEATTSRLSLLSRSSRRRLQLTDDDDDDDTTTMKDSSNKRKPTTTRRRRQQQQQQQDHEEDGARQEEENNNNNTLLCFDDDCSNNSCCNSGPPKMPKRLSDPLPVMKNGKKMKEILCSIPPKIPQRRSDSDIYNNRGSVFHHDDNESVTTSMTESFSSFLEDSDESGELRLNCI